MDRAERLLDLLASLLAQRRPTPFAEIRGWFPSSYGSLDDGVALRKFERDRRALRRLGIRVKTAREVDGHAHAYYIDRQATELPDLDLDREELTATHLAAASLLANAAFPYRDALARALEKIALKTDAPVDDRAAETAKRIIIHHPSPLECADVQRHVQKLEAALTNRRAIRIAYRTGHSGAAGVREVEPYGLACRQGRWLFVGRDIAKDSVRVFAVRRIDQIDQIDQVAQIDRTAGHEISKQPAFDVPTDFDLARFVGIKEWMFARHVPLEIEVSADPEDAWMIERDLGVPSTEGCSDRRRTFRIRVTNAEALISWILSMGPRLRVESPEPVRARVIALLEEMEAAS